MSQAFERALDEIERLWEASDRFDSKVLQFVGITAAGFVAGGAIILQKVPRMLGLPLPVLVTASSGALAILAFFALAIRSAIGKASTGPIDPRLLELQPEYLSNDQTFENDALPALALAFHRLLRRHSMKWRWFIASLVFLGSGTLCLIAAATLYCARCWKEA